MSKANYIYITRPNFQLHSGVYTTESPETRLYDESQTSMSLGAENLGGCKMFLSSLELAKKI